VGKHNAFTYPQYSIQLIILIIAIGITSWKNNTGVNVDFSENRVFSPVLEKEILKMIEIKNNKKKEKGICNVIISSNKEEICTVTIFLSSHIVKETIKFTPPSDLESSNMQSEYSAEETGYTFLGNELVACYIISTDCNGNLINKKELIPFKDSIPGYPHAFNNCSSGTEETPMLTYEIVRNDSLKLLEEQWIY